MPSKDWRTLLAFYSTIKSVSMAQNRILREQREIRDQRNHEEQERFEKEERERDAKEAAEAARKAAQAQRNRIAIEKYRFVLLRMNRTA